MSSAIQRETTPGPTAETPHEQQQLLAEGISVSLTHSPLDIPFIIASVKSPKAGAIVLFAGPHHLCSPLNKIIMPFSEIDWNLWTLTHKLGTTRDSFANKPVLQLQYTAYPALALRSMLSIAQSVKEKHSLTAISLVHRLGVVPIAEESILIAVSAPHRQAAWRAGEEALERVKEKVEIWKLEEFQGEQGGVWRANRDGQGGARVKQEDIERSVEPILCARVDGASRG
ncbi:Molybdopterin synthase catalytic subunit [Peltigera leucophlebia]|nr:Molybdopterin synthase catalytic subunit [Peltigera leucophlebia]